MMLRLLILPEYKLEIQSCFQWFRSVILKTEGPTRRIAPKRYGVTRRAPSGTGSRPSIRPESAICPRSTPSRADRERVTRHSEVGQPRLCTDGSRVGNDQVDVP